MKLIVSKVYEKSESGDYGEFEAMRSSLLSWATESCAAATAATEPPRAQCRPVDPRDLIRLFAIVGG